MSVLLRFSMVSADRGEIASAHVSAVIRMIREAGVDYWFAPMGTLIETAEVSDALVI